MKTKLTLKLAGLILSIVTVLQFIPVYAENKPSAVPSTVGQATDEYHLNQIAVNDLVAYNEYGMPTEPVTVAASSENATAPAAPDGGSKSRGVAAPATTSIVSSKAATSSTTAKSNSITVAGRTLSYTKKLNMKATAYTADPSENGKWGAVDALGNDLKLGTVAVDPKVIPLGTKLFVTGYQFKHLPQGGFVATASDTGGAIKGNKIDLFVPVSKKTGNTFGVQQIKVYVLK